MGNCFILSCTLSSQGRSLTGTGLGHDQLGGICRALTNPLVTAPCGCVRLYFYSVSLAHRALWLVANSRLETIGSLMSDVPIPRGSEDLSEEMSGWITRSAVLSLHFNGHVSGTLIVSGYWSCLEV